MTSFEDFISEMPGLPEWARRLYVRIDTEAARIGATLKDRPDPDKYRADLLARDPSGRLAAMPQVHIWARMPDNMGGTFANWYVPLLLEHVKHLRMFEEVA